jgi:hypothetical protein
LLREDLQHRVLDAHARVRVELAQVDGRHACRIIHK